MVILSFSENEVLAGFRSGVVWLLSLATLKVESEIFYNKNQIEFIGKNKSSDLIIIGDSRAVYSCIGRI